MDNITKHIAEEQGWQPRKIDNRKPLTIIDAIESGEEKTLPGLGVMFEILWNGSSDSEKETLVSRITNCLKPKAI